ncbi:MULTISPECIES: hypothetical protein [Pseudomonas]|uniref:hypothetical protein n=1 Tax=Pseudomonas TaxID=286 RepID=UPI00083D464F|nr:MULTISPECIES: hypothetical protein [Pseudomonas]MBC3456574.1 hypothetical protein [Pseudomonas mosselii]MDH1530746.1 hypothetical protein [Pseudomonas mosselii]ODB39133.1 hypothetical protein A9L43_17180 [Pseudomonas mosselii]OWQ33219.1 hypothetical protein CC207_25925 [Pseudomonas sp. DrBHI1]
MTVAYDLYGAKDLGLLSAKVNVERTLGEALEERDSSYQGGVYYMLGGGDAENFVLKLNIDPFDGDAVEENYPDYTVLLYINATDRSFALERIMRQAGFKLLRHEVF